jgi:hypothetical protein
MEEPFANGEERDAQGRFTVGNRAAAGHARPFAEQRSRLRWEFYHAISAEDVAAIAQKLVTLAKGGDLQAIKLLLLWALGKPPEPVWPDATPAGGLEAPPADLPHPLDRTTDPTYQTRLHAAARQLGPVILAARQALSAPPGATSGDHPDDSAPFWRSNGLEAMGPGEHAWSSTASAVSAGCHQPGPPGAIGEKCTVSQHGHEDVSHEQRLLYLGKQWVVQYGISCTYGCTAVLLRTIGTCDRDPRSL